MYRFVLRKILNNKWLMSCLLLGTILTTAMVSAIPMFTDGVTVRLLRRDLSMLQQQTGNYPGWNIFKVDLRHGYDATAFPTAYAEITQALSDFDRQVRIPRLSSVHRVGFDTTVGHKISTTGEQDLPHNHRVDAFTDLESHVTLVTGALPDNQVRQVDAEDKGDGDTTAELFQAAITVSMANKWNLKVGDTLDLSSRLGLNSVRYHVEISGIINIAATEDAYWYAKADALGNSFILNYEALMGIFGQPEHMMLTNHEWMFAYDYSKMNLSDMQTLQTAMLRVSDSRNTVRGMDYQGVALDTLTACLGRVRQLHTTLLVLEVPLLLMLAFYIFMVSSLIIDYERNEISVIKSRGGNNAQVLWLYLLQSLALGFCGLLAGPFVSMLICSGLGACNGFLSFVDRAALPIHYSPAVLGYAALAMAFSVGTMLLPAMLQARRSIVEHKARKNRAQIAFWKKAGLDLILLAVSLYGISVYRNQAIAMRGMTQTAAANMPLDPLLFVLSMTFVLGAGLLCLRLYPYLMALVFHIGRKRWNAPLYATFLQVGRSRGVQQFIMLFLIMTVGIGLFSANAARTINSNQAARVEYAYGADMVLTANWSTSTIYLNAEPGDLLVDDNGQTQIREGSSAKKKIVYDPLPETLFDDIEGIANTARVYRPDRAAWVRGGTNTQLNGFMAIDAYDFAQTAYAPPPINGQFHWYHYVNWLTQYEYGVLVSSGFAAEFRVEVGDEVTLSWEKEDPLNFIVVGVVDYWPTLDPTAETDENSDRYKKQPLFAIANLSYCTRSRGTLPYEVWMKRQAGATAADIYQDMAERDLPVLNLADGRAAAIAAQNDPLLQGTNGALTLCFLMTMFISLMGFIIYWALSLKARALQFGIYRAIGLKMRQVIIMLIAEQLLVSGVAVALGVVVGSLNSLFYVPLLEIVYTFAGQAPAFRVVTSAGDSVKIFIFLALMLAAGCLMMARMAARIKITQAIKLGED